MWITIVSLLSSYLPKQMFDMHFLKKAFFQFVQKKHSYVSKVGVFSCGPGMMTKSVTDGVEAVNRSVLNCWKNFNFNKLMMNRFMISRIDQYSTRKVCWWQNTINSWDFSMGFQKLYFPFHQGFLRDVTTSPNSADFIRYLSRPVNVPAFHSSSSYSHGTQLLNVYFCCRSRKVPYFIHHYEAFG